MVSLNNGPFILLSDGLSRQLVKGL